MVNNIETLVIASNVEEWQLHQEALGFEIEVAALNGIAEDGIFYQKVPNSRLKDKWTEENIRKNWASTMQKAYDGLRSQGVVLGEFNGWPAVYSTEGKPIRFNGDRLRVEGFTSMPNGGLQFLLSDETYAAHDFLRNTQKPKAWQGNLHTINGIVLTSDNYFTTGWRRAHVTDQQVEHIIPAGFIDARILPKPEDFAESPQEAVYRKFFEEFGMIGTHYGEKPVSAAVREFGEELISPEGIVDRAAIKLIGVVYNSYNNHDYTCTMIIPVNAARDQITLPEAQLSEHSGINFTATDYDSLVSKLFEMSMMRDATSGHARGDIALLIGHLHGPDAFKEAIKEARDKLTTAIEYTPRQ
ncbi:MAG: hypothetical protein AABX51_02645 [Nanoarchaeota archaeon]